MASSTGTSHLAAARPCQDSHGCAVLHDSGKRPVVVLVASDGAGSAAVADVGASLACRSFVRLVEDYLSGGGQVKNIGRKLVERWIAGIVFGLTHHAEARGHALQDYACTLLAAIVTEGAAVFVQIGDGAIVVSGGMAGAWNYVFWPQHGEFANSTNFLTSESPCQALEFASNDGAFEEIALFSDGLENLVLRRAEKAVYAPFFDTMFKSVRRSQASGIDETLSRELERYLSTPPITLRTDDDKTLILASRRRDPSPSPWSEAPA